MEVEEKIRFKLELFVADLNKKHKSKDRPKYITGVGQ